MIKFTDQPLHLVIKQIQSNIKQLRSKEILEFEVLNPDIISSSYAGTQITINSINYIYRDIKCYSDLAQILYCKMLTPIINDKHTIIIRFEKLDQDISFHKELNDISEKYGTESQFAEIDKNEEASFLYYYMQALENVKLEKRLKVLNLGINTGDEFETILQYNNLKNMKLTGIDHCPSAIKEAKKRFKQFDNISFIQADINELHKLDIGKFDLIITIGTLQSSTLNFKPLFMSIIQNHLESNGAVIMGFPNCRWIDGSLIYGAHAKNYNFNEASVLFNDVTFCKKYLQQKKFRVTITGKDYIFLTATSIKKG